MRANYFVELVRAYVASTLLSVSQALQPIDDCTQPEAPQERWWERDAFADHGDAEAAEAGRPFTGLDFRRIRAIHWHPLGEVVNGFIDDVVLPAVFNDAGFTMPLETN